MKSRRRKKHSFSVWVAMSLGLHISLFAGLFWRASLLQKPKPEVVEMEIVKEEPKEEKKPERKVAAKPPPPPVPIKQQEQVVEQEVDTDKKDPTPDTNFLSEKNHVVKHQTSGAHKEEPPKENKPKKVSAAKEPEFKPIVADDAESQVDSFVPQEAAEPPKEAESENNHSIDYIKDLDAGTETLLTSKEFVFYAYYARVRKQLNRHWEPKVRQKLTQLARSGRRIASREDMVTKLLITLDKKGLLLRAQVIGNSGVRDLDQVAVDAFRAAGPFPNPPEGMIDPDGLIKIRWNFVLESKS